MQHFTHLHLHSEFSLLDGAISLDKLIDFGKKHDLKALAITDHGNIFGAVKFFEKCKKASIKPILGMEAYFTEDIGIKSIDKKYYHLIILVQNQTGYKNLCKLISHSFQRGFYFKPRIDYALLEQYNEGLIVTSACLGGHIPSLLMAGDMQEAERRVDWFVKVFGPDRFYLEVQPEDQKDQATLNAILYQLAAKKNIPLVATADCHYVSAEDRQAHEVMLSIQTQHKISDPDRFTFGDCRVHMRTTQEMLELFKSHPQAVWNTGKIADMCDFKFETGNLFFPDFQIPENYTPETYFNHLCTIGLEKLFSLELIDRSQEKIYWDRLNLEASLIIKMGFVGYFLVVSDFIQWAKRNSIPVGPGRGSAAGSLVAWALEITNIDPIKYNLLFERFLNPERVTMPDIDIDFCIEGRDHVINYVRDRYGHDKVGQIITFGTMMAKGVVKDVARVLGFSFEDSNAITNLIPEQLKITLKEALELEPKLQELINNNPKVAQLFDLAFRLEGLTRHASKHAAGIVISPQPIDEVLPVYVPSKSTELVTQYAMTELETLGFLKIDFLGLKNLTLIDRTLKRIKQYHNLTINIDKLPLNDSKTFNLLCQGKTSGVFQLESDGLKEVLRKLQPEKFEDIIAVNALYRPGPLGSGMVDDFIQRKHGQQTIEYFFPELEATLQETYGVIVYQEQVMKIASIIGGYSLGEADILRRAMGKKKADVMAEQRAFFNERAISKGFDGTKAGQLFDLMAYFAGYGFNKSHSAAYALIAYQTAYLKANYPAEFMACLISLESDNADSMSFYLQEAKELAIPILPPNINSSNIDFAVIKGELLFGLKGIKNVGLAALENIIAEQTKKPFLDLYDFCKRIDLRTANKRVIESLICAGAFDSLPGNRAQNFEELSKIIELALEYKKALTTGQMGLFQNPHSVESNQVYSFSPLQEWDNKTKLEKEQEVIGFFLSAHPLDAYNHLMRWFCLKGFTELLDLSNQSLTSEPNVISCGLLKTNKTILTKKGEKMAFLGFEDAQAKAEVVVFPSLFSKIESYLGTYSIFLVRGGLDLTSSQQCKIKAQDLIPLDLALSSWPISSLVITMPLAFELSLPNTITQLLPPGTIPLHIQFQENNKTIRLKTKSTVLLDAQKLIELEKHNITIQLAL